MEFSSNCAILTLTTALTVRFLLDEDFGYSCAFPDGHPPR